MALIPEWLIRMSIMGLGTCCLIVGFYKLGYEQAKRKPSEWSIILITIGLVFNVLNGLLLAYYWVKR